MTITLKETTITGPSTVPATLNLAIESGEGDLPFFDTTCTCPAGTAVSGFFGAPTSPAGNTLTVTAVANVKTINGIETNSPVSLPSTCAGTGTGCLFTATDLVDSFSDSIGQNVTFSGTTSLRGTVTVKFVNAGNTVTFPLAVAQLTPAGKDSPDAAAILSGALLSPLAISAKLDITSGQLQLASVLTLGAGSPGIAPLEFVNVTVGTPPNVYSATLQAGSFAQGPHGQLVFQGTVKGVALQVRITPLGGSSFGFNVDAGGVNLTGVTNPVPVAVTINANHGTALVTAQIGG